MLDWLGETGDDDDGGDDYENDYDDYENDHSDYENDKKYYNEECWNHRLWAVLESPTEMWKTFLQTFLTSGTYLQPHKVIMSFQEELAK